MKFHWMTILLLIYGQAFADSEKASDFAAGQQVFQVYCADLCHQAPQARRLKPAQWRIVLDTMQIRMQSVGMAPLTDTQIHQVFTYLKQQGP